MKWILLSDILSTWGYTQITALLNLHLIDQGYQLEVIGLANSLVFVTGLIFTLPAGLFADIVGYRMALSLGAVLLALGSWGKLLAGPEVLPLYAAFAVTGLAMTLPTASKTPQIAALVSPSRLPSSLALCRGAAAAAALVGGASATYLCWLTSSYTPALLTGALLVTLSPLPLLALPAPKPFRFGIYAIKPWLRLGDPRRLVSFACFALATSLVYPFINLWLSGRGFSPSMVSLSLMGFYTASILAWPSTIILQKLLRRPLEASLLGLIASGLSCLWWQQDLLWVGHLFLWHMFLASALAHYYAAFSRNLPGEGLSYARLGLIYMGGSALGPYLGGLLLAQSFNALMVSSTFLLGVAVLSLPSPSPGRMFSR